MLVNKKIILSVLIIGCIATVASAGTWAYYSTSATSSGNSFTAGNMKITLTAPIGSTGIKPGDTIGDKSFTVQNDGNIDIKKMKVQFKINNGEDLSKSIYFNKIVAGTQNLENKDTLSSLNGKSYIYHGNIPAGNSVTVTLDHLEMPKEVTIGQGQTCNLEVTFTGYQDDSQDTT